MEKNINAALALFKLNVEMYPTSSNVYDSYGEALLKNGQKDLAVENYKKSIGLNPGNTNGMKTLEKLGVKLQTENVDVPVSTLESYLGTYELNPGFNIVITRDGKQLFGQATGQEKFELFAKNAKEFYLKIVNAQITFDDVDKSLTLYQNGQVMKGKRIN